MKDKFYDIIKIYDKPKKEIIKSLNGKKYNILADINKIQLNNTFEDILKAQNFYQFRKQKINKKEIYKYFNESTKSTMSSLVSPPQIKNIFVNSNNKKSLFMTEFTDNCESSNDKINSFERYKFLFLFNLKAK